jgi:hypothetical protein
VTSNLTTTALSAAVLARALVVTVVDLDLDWDWEPNTDAPICTIFTRSTGVLEAAAKAETNAGVVVVSG